MSVSTDRLVEDSTDRLVEDSTDRPITLRHPYTNIYLSSKRALERKSKWKAANDHVGGAGYGGGAGVLRTRSPGQEDPTTKNG